MIYFTDEKLLETEFIRKENQQKAIWCIGLLTLLLTIIICFGLSCLYSATYVNRNNSLFLSQITSLLVAFTASACTIFLGTKKITSWINPILIIMLAVLFYTATCTPKINGAHRWLFIKLGSHSISIQPSELMKVVLVLWLSNFLGKNQHYMTIHPWKRVIFPAGGIMACPIMLVLAGKDYGTTALLLAVTACMLYAAGFKLRYLLPLSGVFLFGAYEYIKRNDPTRYNRILLFRTPEQYAQNETMQQWYSILALGSGGWVGQGFSESRLKWDFLPESESDFILSVAGEEFGFLVMLMLIIIYLFLGFLGITIGTMAKSIRDKYIAFGMSIFILMQAMINLGVISCAFPTKGMPAPFISFGGTNMMACLIGVSCIISIALDIAIPNYTERLRDKVLPRKKKMLNK